MNTTLTTNSPEAILTQAIQDGASFKKIMEGVQAAFDLGRGKSAAALLLRYKAEMERVGVSVTGVTGTYYWRVAERLREDYLIEVE